MVPDCGQNRIFLATRRYTSLDILVAESLLAKTVAQQVSKGACVFNLLREQPELELNWNVKFQIFKFETFSMELRSSPNTTSAV